MKKSEMVIAFITFFITGPIWYYLLYSILSAIQVDRLVWFLFWIYVPLVILSGILTGVVAKMEEE